MGKYVYRQVGENVDGLLINARTKQVTRAMRFRGDVDDTPTPSEDPESFARWQGRLGYLVEVHDSLVGDIDPKTRHLEYPISVPTLVQKFGSSARQCKQMGCSAKELQAAGFAESDLLDAGFTDAELS